MSNLKNFYINGQWVAPEAAQDFDVINPSNEEVCATISLGGQADTNAAVAAARAAFDDLCGQALGAADYLAIANTFSALILEGVPQMGPENRNEAKRFVTLIDALYESKTKLIMSSAVPPTDLYENGDGAFEFERTVSRLTEMRSQAYLGAGHERIGGEIASEHEA